MEKKLLLILILSGVLLLAEAKEAQAGLIVQRPLYIGLASGLVGYWSFEDSDMSGERAYDKSGQGNTGLLTNGPVRKSGRIGQALSFDGVNDYVNVPQSSSINFGDDFTAGFWTNTQDTTNESLWYNNSWILDKDVGGAGGSDWGVVMKNGNVVFITGRGDAVNDDQLTSTNTINDGNWHYVVVARVRSSGQKKIYIDGTENGNAIHGTNSISNTDDLNIGGDSSATISRFINGLIDDVRIYNRALSPDEIKRLYKIGATMKIGMSQPAGSLKDGLVGYWTFDDNNMAGERAYDLSGQGNTGLLTNGPVRAAGRIGQALKFDGGDDYVNINKQYGLTDSMTFTAWVKFDSLTGWQGIIAQDTGDWATNNGAIYFLKTTDGAAGGGRPSNALGLMLPISQTDVTSGAYNTVAVTTNRWYFMAGTYDGANVRFYQDGQFITSDSRTGNIAGQTGNLAIGAEYYNNGLVDYVKGLIDDVRIYNRALSSDEIKRLYKIGATMKINVPSKTGTLQDGLVGYWSFDDSDMAGERAYDQSGNGNTGLLTNGPVRKAGRIGQALKFDGSDDYVNAGSNASLDNLAQSNITLSAWIKPYTLGVTAGRIALKRPAAHGAGGWLLAINNTATFGGTTVSSAGTGLADSKAVDNSITFNAWQHIAMTYSDTSGRLIKLYVNGSEVAYQTQTAGTASPASDAAGNFTIGNEQDGSRTFDGLIDDVRIYNRALTSDEIKRLYNMGR